MRATTWGVLHPGAMGASMVGCLAAAGRSVLWCAEGRSAATAERAQEAGAVTVASLADLTARCDAIVSVCPPGAALALARQVASCGFDGLYLDANAIAPVTAREVAVIVGEAGAVMVDGGIVGPPAEQAGTTRLFVSGSQAEQVVTAFAGSFVDVIAIEGDLGAASALKAAYATWTKAVAAALLTVRAYAEAEGVTGPLLDEWRRSQPGTVERSELSAAAVGPKAWRFGDEMRQLAAAMEDVGLPGEFQAAAGLVYDRLAPLKDRAAVDLDQVIELLVGDGAR